MKNKYIWFAIAIMVFSIASCRISENLMNKTAMEKGYEIDGGGINIILKQP